MCLHSVGGLVFTLAYTRRQSEGAASVTQAMQSTGQQRVCVCVCVYAPSPITFHGRCHRRRCGQSTAGKSRVCNSIKKELEGLLRMVVEGRGGDGVGVGGGGSMCDGGWGLVCPEAHEAAAA